MSRAPGRWHRLPFSLLLATVALLVPWAFDLFWDVACTSSWGEVELYDGGFEIRWPKPAWHQQGWRIQGHHPTVDLKIGFGLMSYERDPVMCHYLAIPL